MPAEPTKAKLKRRSSRKDLDDFRFDGTHARELELKRTRGEVSCAECRRLKIKCDKQIPCQSCVRRGCVSLCPNGSLATGQGTRFVLAATEHLHGRIAKLNGRIRQLEDALQALQAKTSLDPHPLLHKDLLSTEEQDRNEEVEEKDVEVTDPAAALGGEILNAFGTLSMCENGVSRFFGPTGGSESLLMAGSTNHDSDESTAPVTSESNSGSPTSIGTLTLFSRSFPFTPVGQPAQIQELIETSHLPPFEDAVAYADIYQAQVSWLFRGVTRAQIVDDMLPVIYKQRPPPAGEDYSNPHDLGLLFIIFAIACFLGEDHLKPYSDHYFQISRVALSLQPILEKPSLVTIQALDLQSMYIAMTGGGATSSGGSETSMEATWSLITLASNLSQTIGLHRDSSRWGLSPKTVQRRSIMFWDLFVSDVWQSLNTGRPPSFSLAYVDCPFPKYEDAEKNPAHAFEVWQSRFAAEVVTEVAGRTLTTEVPSYSTIMDLDRKVRDFPNPDSMSDADADDFSKSSQRRVLDHVRETVLLYIHRSFFAQAIIDHPENPLKSPYAPSFLAAYRASTTIMQSVQDQFEHWPKASAAFWTMWTFAFSAAVVFGTVVTRGPRSPLAKSAMGELEKACILFSKASANSVRAAKALPVLKKLAEKARHSLNAAQSDPSGENGLHWSVKQEDTEDELSIFIGRTRFVAPKRNADPPSTQGPSSQESSPHVIHSSTPEGRSEPTDPSYKQTNSHPVISLDVSMHGPDSGWVPSHDRYEPDIPSSRSSQQYSYHTNTATPANGTTPPDVNYAWSQLPPQGQPEHYDPQRLAEPTRRYSVNPSAHQNDQYYDSGPSTVPINHRSQSYYSTPSNGYSQAVYGSQHQTPAYASNSSSLVPPSAHSYADQPQSNYHNFHHPQSSSAPYNPQQYSMYSTTPAFHPTAPPANPALEEMGMVSRDSRLDQKWSSFVSDTGILDGFNYRHM